MACINLKSFGWQAFVLNHKYFSTHFVFKWLPVPNMPLPSLVRTLAAIIN